MTHPKSTKGKPGSRVELTVKTNPSARTYTWYFKEKPIIEADNYEGISTNQLVISELAPQHKGTYRCIATNDFNEECTSEKATITLGKFVDLIIA